MNVFRISLFAVVAVAVPAWSMTVTAPKSGAHLASPFSVVASAKTCQSAPATSMGYSIDDGPVTIVATSFSATVSASLGKHTVHVKCWGSNAQEDAQLVITVSSVSSTPIAAMPAFSPAAGEYTSQQLVKLAAATPGAAIYYTTDGSTPTTSSARYSGALAVSTSAVIQALAVAPGYAASSMARAQYLIQTHPTIPSTASMVSGIQLLPTWKYNHDPGTEGSSVGVMSIVSTPSLSGKAAEFATSYLNWGGEIYSRSWGTDPNATNFLYDAEVWIAKGSQLANLEMDNNQVIPNGDTVIYAFQCAGTSGTWDYSMNAGTRTAPVVKWMHSSQPCNPAEWTPDMWHHVQIGYSRDSVGNVTYKSVWLDGIEAPINETVPSAFALGWANGDLLTNFQVDGVGAGGASVLYLDELTFYRW